MPSLGTACHQVSITNDDINRRPPVVAPGGGFGGAFCLAALPLAAFAFGLLGDLQIAGTSMTWTSPHSNSIPSLCSDAIGTGTSARSSQVCRRAKQSML
jgi:hypothetical protein